MQLLEASRLKTVVENWAQNPSHDSKGTFLPGVRLFPSLYAEK